MFVVSLPVTVSFSLLGGALSAHASLKGTNSHDNNSKTDDDGSDYSDSEEFEANSEMESSAVSAIFPSHLNPIDRTYHVDAFNRFIRQERLKIDSKLQSGKMTPERHSLESARLQRGHELAGKIGASPGRTLESHRNHTSEVNEAYNQFLQSKKEAWKQAAQAGGPGAAKITGKIQRTEELQGALRSYGESLAKIGQSTNNRSEVLKTDLEVANSYLNIAEKFKRTVSESRPNQLGAAEGYYSDVKDYTERLQAHHDAWEHKENLVRQKARPAELLSADEAINSTKASLDIAFQSVQQSHKRLVGAVDYKFHSSAVPNATRVPSGSPVSSSGGEGINIHIQQNIGGTDGGGGDGGGATSTHTSHTSNHQSTVTDPQKPDTAKRLPGGDLKGEAPPVLEAQDAKMPEGELKRKNDLLDAAKRMGMGVAGIVDAANKAPSGRENARSPEHSKKPDLPRKSSRSNNRSEEHSKGGKPGSSASHRKNSSSQENSSSQAHGDKGHSQKHSDSHADAHGEPHDDHFSHHGNHHGAQHENAQGEHPVQKDSDKHRVDQILAPKAEGKENDPVLGAAAKVAQAVKDLVETENETPEKKPKRKLAQVEEVRLQKTHEQHLLGSSKGYLKKEAVQEVQEESPHPKEEKSEKKENAVFYLRKGDCYFRLEAKEISGGVNTLKKFYTDRGYEELSLVEGEDDLNVLVANMHSVAEHVKNDTSGSSCDPDKAREIEGGSHSKVFRMEVLNQESAKLLKASITH